MMIDENKLAEEFANFCQSIQEDDPLPFETKFVYILLEFKNKNIEVSYSADENLILPLDFGFFSPLEAQFFYSKNLLNLSSKLNNETTLKDELILLFKNIAEKYLKNLKMFKGYKFIVGERFYSNYFLV